MSTAATSSAHRVLGNRHECGNRVNEPPSGQPGDTGQVQINVIGIT